MGGNIEKWELFSIFYVLCIKEVFVGRNVGKIGVWAWVVLLLFVFSCENEVKKLRIKVESDAIFVDGKEVAKTADVAKQDTLMIGTLSAALRDKREAEIAEFLKANKNSENEYMHLVQVQIAPNISYDVFFKIIASAGASGYTNINFTSKINGKKYTEIVYLPERSDLFGDNKLPCQDVKLNIFEKLIGIKEAQPKLNENCLKLTLAIYEDYFEIWAGGNSLPKIPVVNPIDSTYSKLEKILAEVRNRFINSPDNDKIVILGEDDTKISNIIQAMHIAGTIGFNKKNLSKLATKSVQRTKEDSIRSIRIGEEFKARQRIIDSLFSLGLDTSSFAKLFVENGVFPFFGEDTSSALNFAKHMIKMRIQSEKRRR